MNIVYTFDDGFAEITGVSIISLLENNRDVEYIDIYIVDCGISDVNKQKLEEIVVTYRRNIFFIDAFDLVKRISYKPESYTWSPVCYERLFYSELLPATLDKVLHIDCDTIVRISLSELYNTNIDDVYCAGCYDCTPKPKQQAGLPKDTKYISNGVLLLNLKLWRLNNLPDRFVQYIIEKEGKLPHLDQDVLNAVANDRVMVLPAKFDMMPITLMYRDLCVTLFDIGEPYYSADEIKKAVTNPAIIHFTGFRYTRRPWEQPCNHWYNDEWMRYYFLAAYSKNRKLLIQKKRKWIMVKQGIAWVWLTGSKIPIIRNVFFKLDCKYVYNFDL